MPDDYSTDTIGQLEARFGEMELHRPLRRDRYEPGTELTYDVTGVAPARAGRVRLRVEKFVGGGFAGQVYRVEVLEVDAPAGPLAGLDVGGTYAMKILVPPSRGARKFRDAIYRVGFQAPFQLQVNPAAARAGALWQKFIRRAAAVRLGTERAVVDILATFVDHEIGSCGEISEWVDGRTWLYEVDPQVMRRWHWRPGKPEEGLGSPEYRAKRHFMADMVRLLHDVGAPELARQYEWWTCKSQPNTLKRSGDDGPAEGLTAVDFRAGLALLFFLPMAPGDVPLAVKGLCRGSLVQFDRGNVPKLRRFVADHPDHFADMAEALDELETAERTYRDSQIDITHNLPRFFYSGRLWATLRRSAVTGWETTNRVDEPAASGMRKSVLLTLLFGLLGLTGKVSLLAGLAVLLAGVAKTAFAAGHAWPWSWQVTLAAAGLLVPVPFVLGLLRRLWGRGDFRRHLGAILTRPSYLLRTLRAMNIERQIRWHRTGRVGPERAVWLVDHPVWSLANLAIAFLPAKLHRMVTDGPYARRVLHMIFVRPVKLYFNPAAREQWLRDMLAEGRRHHMLSDEDAEAIERQIKEPFIQKYLKSLAVHVCTLPVTQLVSVGVAIWDWTQHPDMPWEQAWGRALLILAAFQITPISPGSLTRGLYVLYLVIRERNFKDYNIAVFLGFFKYVGYLAFPIQMAYRYPALARFMAAHWATGAVHVVPVFGERGALLEHAVFDLFYNYPLSLRRRARGQSERRKSLRPRWWHAPICGVLGGAALAGIVAFQMRGGNVAGLRSVWYAAVLVPLAAGLAAARWAGGMAVGKRIALGAVAGLIAAPVCAAGRMLAMDWLAGVDFTGPAEMAAQIAKTILWPAFGFTLAGLLGAVLAEISIPDTADAIDTADKAAA